MARDRRYVCCRVMLYTYKVWPQQLSATHQVISCWQTLEQSFKLLGVRKMKADRIGRAEGKLSFIRRKSKYICVLYTKLMPDKFLEKEKNSMKRVKKKKKIFFLLFFILCQLSVLTSRISAWKPRSTVVEGRETKTLVGMPSWWAEGSPEAWGWLSSTHQLCNTWTQRADWPSFDIPL